MKRLTRKNLDELAEQMPVISEIDQQSFIGGGDGSQNFPYTIEEYENMVINGTWKGGFVDSGGYISQDTTSIASGRIVNEFNDIRFTPMLCEGIGYQGAYSIHSYSIIENGQMVVLVNVKNPSNIGLSASGYATLKVNGSVIATQSLALSGEYMYSSGTIPIGSTCFNLSQYSGYVEVSFNVYTEYNSGSGYDNSSFNRTIYSNYR